MLVTVPMTLRSYVVRYDSGFAPNPFFGFCTLATCKPKIRQHAAIGDWIVGTGSANKKIKHGDYLVYAMRVTEALTFEEYWCDPRFQNKKPILNSSREQACGDNIYFRNNNNAWQQLNSFHSNKDGSLHQKHTEIDTAVNRILVSDNFTYFGGHGPKLPSKFRNHAKGRDICKKGAGGKNIIDQEFIEDFISWVKLTGDEGYIARPYDWAKMP